MPEFHPGYVELLVESEWATGKKSNGKLYSDTQQQQDYPGDLFLEFLNDLINKKIVWGDNRAATLGTAAESSLQERVRRESDR